MRVDELPDRPGGFHDVVIDRRGGNTQYFTDFRVRLTLDLAIVKYQSPLGRKNINRLLQQEDIFAAQQRFFYMRVMFCRSRLYISKKLLIALEFPVEIIDLIFAHPKQIGAETELDINGLSFFPQLYKDLLQNLPGQFLGLDEFQQVFVQLLTVQAVQLRKRFLVALFQ